MTIREPENNPLLHATNIRIRERTLVDLKSRNTTKLENLSGAINDYEIVRKHDRRKTDLVSWLYKSGYSCTPARIPPEKQLC